MAGRAVHRAHRWRNADDDRTGADERPARGPESARASALATRWRPRASRGDGRRQGPRNDCEKFFTRFGFEQISRSDVPAKVQASIEFQSACPALAIVMRKRLVSER